MSILAKCIKTTYTWDGDGEQHTFPNVKVGHIYGFDRDRDGTYWIDPTLASTEDFQNKHGFIKAVERGVCGRYFKEMFELV